MSTKLIKCKVCEAEIAKNAKACPQCGAKNKKPIFKKWWFWAIVIVILIASCSAGGSEEDQTTEISVPENTTVQTSEVTETTSAEESTSSETVPTDSQTVYHVGDVLQDGDLKIVYMSSGEYREENDYLQPEAGYKYIFLQFAFENASDGSDAFVSSYDFECYADGYSVEQYYGGDEDLSATLSAGRSTTGYIYFTVPVDATEIDVEYETNFFTDDKIHFLYEGEQDSGYTPQLNAAATEGAHCVGETVDLGDLKISYLSCQEYISDNQFYQPREGYQFICCEFEFENTGSSDEFVDNTDFDCYADGTNCEQSYVRDDMLSATLSTGRKAKGTVTFEVPTNATVVETEYLNNIWTSDRIVFTIR